jgi:hypothetical protein
MADRFITVPVRQSTYDIDALTPLPINPSARKEAKALASLLESITKTHIITPLIVAVDNQRKKVFVLDGNRRHHIGKQLGLKTMVCSVVELTGSLTINDAFIAMNIHKPFDGKQDLEMVVKYGFFRVENDKHYYQQLKVIGGVEIFDLMLERKQTLRNIYTKFNILAKYLHLKPEEEKMALRWMVEHRQSYQAQLMPETKPNKVLVRECIATNRPLGKKG